MPGLAFLKLGGSLITEKSRPHTPRTPTIQRLAQEIARARQDLSGLRLILGHGSGSFGHAAASRYGTRAGVRGEEGWLGFAEVWRAARDLNEIVMAALDAAGVPALAFPPSACAAVSGGRITGWELSPLRAALDAGLVPVVNGDVAFDRELGGTIVSTEDVFTFLARALRPQRILYAGIEPGVWADFPARTRIAPALTPAGLTRLLPALGGSAAVDVTGGMLLKVQSTLDLIQDIPGLEASIFSGEDPDSVYAALLGAAPGTRLSAA